MRRGEAGFTLFEALTALVVVAVGFTIVCAAMGTAYRSAGNLKRRAAAIEAARAQLAEAGVTGVLEAGTTTGTYADGSRWTFEVSDLDKPETASDESAERSGRAYWVSVTVQDGSGRPLFKLQTAKVSGAIP